MNAMEIVSVKPINELSVFLRSLFQKVVRNEHWEGPSINRVQGDQTPEAVLSEKKTARYLVPNHMDDEQHIHRIQWGREKNKILNRDQGMCASLSTI